VICGGLTCRVTPGVNGGERGGDGGRGLGLACWLLGGLLAAGAGRRAGRGMAGCAAVRCPVTLDSHSMSGSVRHPAKPARTASSGTAQPILVYAFIACLTVVMRSNPISAYPCAVTFAPGSAGGAAAEFLRWRLPHPKAVKHQPSPGTDRRASRRGCPAGLIPPAGHGGQLPEARTCAIPENTASLD
jgi:hypothetical protein